MDIFVNSERNFATARQDIIISSESTKEALNETIEKTQAEGGSWKEESSASDKMIVVVVLVFGST